jgi:hypothetical protein
MGYEGEKISIRWSAGACKVIFLALRGDWKTMQVINILRNVIVREFFHFKKKTSWHNCKISISLCSRAHWVGCIQFRFFQVRQGRNFLESLYDFRNFVLIKSVPGISASKPIKSVARSFQEFQQLECRFICSAQQLTDIIMPDKQADIHNADETEFPLNNILTIFFYWKRNRARQTYFTRGETFIFMISKNANNSFIPTFLISKGIRVFYKFL